MYTNTLIEKNVAMKYCQTSSLHKFYISLKHATIFFVSNMNWQLVKTIKSLRKIAIYKSKYIRWKNNIQWWSNTPNNEKGHLTSHFLLVKRESHKKHVAQILPHKSLIHFNKIWFKCLNFRIRMYYVVFWLISGDSSMRRNSGTSNSSNSCSFTQVLH